MLIWKSVNSEDDSKYYKSYLGIYEFQIREYNDKICNLKIFINKDDI